MMFSTIWTHEFVFLLRELGPSMVPKACLSGVFIEPLPRLDLGSDDEEAR